MREELSKRLLSESLEARGWCFNISSGAWHAPGLSERLRNVARATVGRYFKRMKERQPWHGFHIIDVSDDFRLPEDTLIAQLRHLYDEGQPIDRAEIRMSVPFLGKGASALWWDHRWSDWWRKN